jgi:hypothetical protein
MNHLIKAVRFRNFGGSCPTAIFKVAHFLRNMPGVIGRGAFIVLEGADRSGKSTQCKLLQTFLAAKGIAASQINFPGRPPESPDARPPASFACAQ